MATDFREISSRLKKVCESIVSFELSFKSKSVLNGITIFKKSVELFQGVFNIFLLQWTVSIYVISFSRQIEFSQLNM